MWPEIFRWFLQMPNPFKRIARNEFRSVNCILFSTINANAIKVRVFLELNTDPFILIKGFSKKLSGVLHFYNTYTGLMGNCSYKNILVIDTKATGKALMEGIHHNLTNKPAIEAKPASNPAI